MRRKKPGPIKKGTFPPQGKPKYMAGVKKKRLVEKSLQEDQGTRASLPEPFR